MRISNNEKFTKAVKNGDINAVISLYKEAKEQKQPIDLNAKIDDLTLMEFAMVQTSKPNSHNHAQIFTILNHYGAKISGIELLNLYIKHGCTDLYYIRKLIVLNKTVKVTPEDLKAVGKLPQILLDTGLFNQTTQEEESTTNVIGDTTDKITE